MYTHTTDEDTEMCCCWGQVAWWTRSMQRASVFVCVWIPPNVLECLCVCSLKTCRYALFLSLVSSDTGVRDAASSTPIIKQQAFFRAELNLHIAQCLTPHTFKSVFIHWTVTVAYSSYGISVFLFIDLLSGGIAGAVSKCVTDLKRWWDLPS